MKLNTLLIQRKYMDQFNFVSPLNTTLSYLIRSLIAFKLEEKGQVWVIRVMKDNILYDFRNKCHF